MTFKSVGEDFNLYDVRKGDDSVKIFSSTRDRNEHQRYVPLIVPINPYQG